ncbi:MULTISPECIES: hypothetical protein [Streptomyces]|uniref:hypothetical protein n=1 Tax=Streptomyces TaxID=1883 RepID=UPI0033D54B99
MSTGLAVTGHHLASGHTASWAAGLSAGALLFLAALLLVRRARSLPVVTTATGAAQALLHAWFGRADGPAVHHGHMADGGGDTAWHAGHHRLSMSLAHLIAALAVSWLMQRADTALRGTCAGASRHLCTALAAVLRRLRAPHPSLPDRPAVRRVRRRARLLAQPWVVVLAHAVVRRGPPVGRALAA